MYYSIGYIKECYVSQTLDANVSSVARSLECGMSAFLLLAVI
jgi:hypothetical protein